MPASDGRLTDKQIDTVATYVAWSPTRTPRRQTGEARSERQGGRGSCKMLPAEGQQDLGGTLRLLRVRVSLGRAHG
jgi:hypothetical protein